MKIKGKVKFVNKDKNQFFTIAKKRVDQYFEDNKISKHANLCMKIKSIVLLASYIVPFVLLLILQPPAILSMFLWIVMGIGVAGIGMSVMHDANHGAYSTNRTVNILMGHTLNLVGGSVFNWKLQHNMLHHTYTNIIHMDDDIQDKGVLRFSPHTKVKFVHQLQWLYAVLFYGIMCLYWVTVKDFIQFVKYAKNGVNANCKNKNALFLVKLIISKLLYFFCLLGVPVLFFNIPILEVVLGFVLMHFVAGIILTIVFQLAHMVEEASHPLPNENGDIENSWAINQLKTTVNFSRNNKILSWYIGGLNFQIEHHLFPSICHVHYPKVSEIVKKTALEFNLPYLENKTFKQALRSHFNTLYKFGRLPELNEAIA